MKRMTLADVADLAGVSRTTVSFVLNENPRSNIPVATQERVRAAAEQLAYRPNHTARALRTNRTLTIGFLSDEIASGLYAVGAIQGAQDAAWAKGRLLLVVNTGGDPRVEHTAADMMMQRQVDGVIYASYFTRSVTPPVVLKGVPMVLVNCFTEDATLPSLIPDEYDAGRRTTERLIALGHRRIAFIGGPKDYWAAGERLRGHKAALESAGIAFRAEVFGEGDWWPESAYHLTMRIQRGLERPSAYLCANDRMALGCCEALRTLGFRVPDDASVVGFDDQEISAHLFPPLASVRLPVYEMGVRAIELLLAEGSSTGESMAEQFRCEYIERASVAAAPIHP